MPPEYSMEIQALVPLALCTLHNFVCKEDPDVFHNDYDADIPEIFHADNVNGEATADAIRGNDAWGELADGPPSSAERRRADVCCDEIAAAMWADYIAQND
ncbi:hypothetical protein BDR03DRAFT_1014183 [Suillus americanus]|nr:hypothetical protein BDR03DRAFT_1014183 [Suillus americanus]